MLLAIVSPHVSSPCDISNGVYAGGSSTNGIPKGCVYNPEELFLFTLTNVKTGKIDLDFVGDYFRGDHSLVSLDYPTSRPVLQGYSQQAENYLVLS